MMKMIFCLLACIILIAACDKSSDANPGTPVIDIDGNQYDTVKIGILSWMKQNLSTSHYRNGDPIPEITSPELWSSLISGAWCWYNNDSVKYAAVYGKLYNWYAVGDPRGLAPEGWHIPSYEEWIALSMSLGDDLVAGGELKETGTKHWTPPNADATNSSGFTGLPGGYRDQIGAFQYFGYYGALWSFTEANGDNAFSRELEYNSTVFNRYANKKLFGFSVRCIRD